MRWFAANLTVIFWSYIFGMIIGYIGSALANTQTNFYLDGLVAAIVALIAVNGTHAFMKSKH